MRSTFAGQRETATAVPLERRGQGRKPRRKWRLRPARFVAALVITYVLGTLLSQQVMYHKLQRQADSIRAEIAVEHERAALLDAEITYRDSDGFIERLARQQLGFVLPGEILVVVGEVR